MPHDLEAGRTLGHYAGANPPPPKVRAFIELARAAIGRVLIA